MFTDTRGVFRTSTLKTPVYEAPKRKVFFWGWGLVGSTCHEEPTAIDAALLGGV